MDSKTRMEEFKEKLIALMDAYGVMVDVGYGEYNYNGIDFVWFVDTHLDKWDRTESLIDIVGDLPRTDDNE